MKNITNSRTKNSKRNVIVSVMFTGLTMLFQFISRYVINRYLGEQYLGISSLFASILQVLNMAELGFAGAIVYNMYKPLANNDTDTVCALLNYYKRIYRIVGTVVLSAGVILIPFVPHLIRGSYPADINIYGIYVLYLANTVISYFLFAYKTSLLEAVQRMDLAKLAYSIVNVVQYLLQILALVLFRNYYLFVVCMVIGSAARNMLAAYLAKKYYPQYDCRGSVSETVKKDVITRVKGLLVCNISGVTYSTLDTIILSVFIGLSSVAMYNNYYTVWTGVTSFIALIRNAMQASVGNSVAKESVEKNYNDMLLWQFLFSVIASWCVSCMLSLYQPFMTLWMGKDLLLSMTDVVLLCMWFNTVVVTHSFFLYLSANGLWWELRGPYIGSTLFNLSFNVILGKFFGITGILISSFLASFFFGLIWQCKIIFRKYFKKSPKQFYIRQALYFVGSGLSAGLCYFACSGVSENGIAGLLIRFAICSVLSFAVLALVYHRTDIFKQAKAFGIKAIKA